MTKQTTNSYAAFAQELYRRAKGDSYIDIYGGTSPMYLELSVRPDGVRVEECNDRTPVTKTISDRKLSKAAIEAALLRLDAYEQETE